MNYKTRIFVSALACVAFAGCEQRDDQALLKVYEVFQRDMQKRDELANGSMKQIQDELAALKESLESLQKQMPGASSGADSAEKLAAAVSDAVGKKVSEQNAASLKEMKDQIAQLQAAVSEAAAAPPSLPAQPPQQTAAAPVPPAPAPAKAQDGLRYRDQPPVEPPPSTSTKSSDSGRKKIKIDF